MKCPDAVVLAGRRIELQNCLPRDEGQAWLSRLPLGPGPEISPRPAGAERGRRWPILWQSLEKQRKDEICKVGNYVGK